MTAFMDRLRLHRIGGYRPDGFLGPKLDISCDPTGNAERVGLSALRLAIYNGDRHAALAVVAQIESSIMMDPTDRPDYLFEPDRVR